MGIFLESKKNLQYFAGILFINNKILVPQFKKQNRIRNTDHNILLICCKQGEACTKYKETFLGNISLFFLKCWPSVKFVSEKKIQAFLLFHKLNIYEIFKNFAQIFFDVSCTNISTCHHKIIGKMFKDGKMTKNSPDVASRRSDRGRQRTSQFKQAS